MNVKTWMLVTVILVGGCVTKATTSESVGQDQTDAANAVHPVFVPSSSPRASYKIQCSMGHISGLTVNANSAGMFMIEFDEDDLGICNAKDRT